MQVKIGAFGKVENFYDMENAGYNFAELDSVKFAGLSDMDFKKFKSRWADSDLTTDVFARALPYDQPILETNDFNWFEFQEFMKKSCFRMGQLEAKMLILGNGKARFISGTDHLAAEERFCKLLAVLCEITAENGITVLLEPLGPKYSNFINTIEEAVNVCRLLKKENLFTMCDLRHMVGSGDSFDNIVKYGEFIKHVHIDNPLSYPQRYYPKKTDGYDYVPYFQALEKAGYSGTLTIEAEIPKNFTEEFRQIKDFFSGYNVFQQSSGVD